jgi:hypothetical protein
MLWVLLRADAIPSEGQTPCGHSRESGRGAGVTVAVPGYDLAPSVTIAEIVAQTRQACLHLLGPNHGHRASGVRAELVGCQAEKCLLYCPATIAVQIS